jgi:hypothetical protein
MMAGAPRIPVSPHGMRSNAPAAPRRAVRMNATCVVLAALAFFVDSRFAAATASLTCDIDDAAIALGLLASVGSLPDALIGTVQGTLTLKRAGGSPPVEIDLGEENFAQRWIDPPEMRLWLFVRGDKRIPEINLVIVMQRTAYGEYGGRYRATLRSDGKTREHAGLVTCTLG